MSSRGEPPSADDAWWAYRTHLPCGYFRWAITRMVDQAIVEYFTRRPGLAVAEPDSFGLLDV